MRVQPAGRMRRIFCEAVLLTMGLHIIGTAVWAGPEGATVVHGTATFQQSGSYTAIQASDKAIINYRSFDVARPETVQFLQPGAGASVLNRIVSAHPTAIDGTILANGRVFFVNPAGVVFGESAQVNVAQLVASALDISNTDFLNGRYDFKGGDGAVVNKGQISAERAYLIGKQVANLGKIDCPGGYVVMAAGDRVFLGEPGTDLVVEVDESTLPNQAAPVDGAAVRNEGSVDVAGGSIVLAAAGDIYAHAISNVGRLSAARADGDAGTVKMTAPGGTAINTGSIEASSESGKGGQVQVLGARVGLFESGRIDASGATGGGTVLVGGDYQGKGEVPTATRTSVGPNASIQADATQDGNGGKVIVWSDEVTTFNGHASAQGAGSGKGGLIEVSGRQDLSFAGTVALGSPSGHGGTLLLDPASITITNGGEDLSPQDDLAFDSEPYQATISELTLENTGGSKTQILLEATNDIVMNDLSDNALTLSPGVSLVLRTRNDPLREENSDGGITMNWADSIVASGGGDLTLQAGHDGTGFVANSAAHVYAGSLVTDGGSVTIQATGNVDVQNVTTAGAANATGGSVLLEAGFGTASYWLYVGGTIDTSGGLDADASGAKSAGSVTLSGGGVYLYGDILAMGGNDNGGDAPGGAGGSVTIGAPSEVFLGAGTIRTSGGSGSLVGNGGNVTFNGPTSLGDDLTISAGTGNVAFQGSVNAAGGEGGPSVANLVINSAGTTQFEAPVGQEVPLTSVTTDAPGTTQINADITTGDAMIAATQTYNDPVVFTGDVTLRDSGTTGIFFNNTVGGNGENPWSLGVVTSDPEAQVQFNGAVTLHSGLWVQTAGGNVTFQGTVDAEAEALAPDLRVESDGMKRFNAAVGSVHPLGWVYTEGEGPTEINANITTNGTLATQTYNSPVVFTNSVVLTDTGRDGISFNNTVAGDGKGRWDLTLTADRISLGGSVSGTGVLTLQPATPTEAIYVGMGSDGGFDLDTTELGYLQNGFAMINIGRLDGQHNLYVYESTFQDPVTFRSPAGGAINVEGEITGLDDASVTLLGSGATTMLSDGIETAGRDIVINDSVLLADNTDITLSTGAGGGNISITGPINGTAGAEDGGDESLTLTAGTGTVTVGDIFGASGAAATNGLTTIHVTTSGPATFGRIGITGALDVAAGATTFLDALSIGSGTLSGTSFSFDGALALGGNLTANATGNVTFLGAIDDDGNPQTSSVLTVNSGGTTRFGATVGGARPIGSLVTDAPGTTEIGANIATAGAQTYLSPVVLTNNVTLADSGSGIAFQNTVDSDAAGPWDLTTITTGGQGSINFGGNLGSTRALDQMTVTNAGTAYINGDMSLEGAFLQNGAGLVSVSNDIVTTGDPITFQRAVTLDGSVVLNTGTGANGHVTFQDALALDGDLTVTTGTGDVTFQGAIDRAALWSAADLVINSAGTTRFEAPVGQQRSVYSITTDAAGTTEIGADITTGTALLAPAPGPATQTYNDPVVLTNNVTLTDYGMDGVFFNNTVNGNGPNSWNLRVETTDAAARVLFNGAVTLGSGLWVQTAGGNVTFQGTVDGPGEGTDSQLAVYSAGTTRFNAAVGGSHPVGQVHTDAAGTTEINANITTGGTQLLATQTYDDPVVLTNSVTLMDTGQDGITFNNTVNGDGEGPWDLTVVTTAPAAEIRFNDDVSLDGGIAATAAGDIYAHNLSSASHNISLRSTGGNVNLQGTVNADANPDPNTGGHGGGVSVVADAGMIQTYDGILDATIIGYSDDQRGVDLPYGTGGKTAILLDSGQSLHIAAYDSLIARGQYAGSYEPFVSGTDASGPWVRDLPGGTFYYDSALVDDRAAVGFSTEPYYGGMAFDVAIYMRSRSAAVTLDTPVTVPDGATVVVDGSFPSTFASVFGSSFVTYSSFADTSRLELVNRNLTPEGPVQQYLFPELLTRYSLVTRGGASGRLITTEEYWHEPASVPPPVPPIIVPPEVVPPIPIYTLEALTLIPRAEVIVGPIQPPHPECLDIKDEDIEVLRKCQVACDLFSTDVSLNIVAEDIVTLNQRLKAQVQQVLPRLDSLSQKWPTIRPEDMTAIEQALREDQALNGWMQDGVEFVKLLRTKLGRTTNDSVERFLLEYLANATDEAVLDFVQTYLKSRLASTAEAGKPVAWIGR